MKTFKLQFNMNNAAFDIKPNQEISRILRQLANDINYGRDSTNIFDINGNKIGSFQIEEQN